MSNEPRHDDVAIITTHLTALANAKACMQIDATSKNTDTVGSVLAIYCKNAGLTVEALTDWLGLDLPSLADLAEELRPGIGSQELGVEQLADLYGADRARLVEAFERGDE